MKPILYSFRRCPYAMRARLALAVSGVQVELREILLRKKAPEFLLTSPSGTVPCLQTKTDVIDESFDIMCWALRQNDPKGWLDMPAAGYQLIEQGDGPFKHALDRTKYASRYSNSNPEAERAAAMEFLMVLERQLGGKAFLFSDRISLADMAILPFVRQFAFIDKPRFDAEAGENLRSWLEIFLDSGIFLAVMQKYAVWQAEDAPLYFPS